jgi:uncharacterized protein (TIGR02001 family)
MMKIKKILLLLSGLLMMSLPSNAQTEFLGGELEFNASLKSDYRFRGVSKTGNDFAVQGGIDWYSDSGIYVGAWASNVSDFRGADLESNFYAGFVKEINGLIYDFGITAYVYPGGTDSRYIEAYGSVGVDFGLLTSSVGIAYMPSQDNLGNQDNVYFYNDTRASIPDTPFNIDLHLGYEDGAFGDGKLDWKIGTSVRFKMFDLGIAYLDTNLQAGKRSDSGVIFSIAAYF